MENITLFKVLKSLSKKELAEIGRFVSSPVFNNRKIVIKYYEVLRNNFYKILKEEMDYEKLYLLLNPSKKFNGKKSTEELKKLNSFLLKVVEKYLSYKGMESDDFYFKQSLVVNLNAKGLYQLGTKHLKNLESEYQTVRTDASNFFWKKFQIEQDKASGFTYSGDDHLASAALQKRARYFIHHTILTSCSVYINLFINEQNFSTDNSLSGYYDFFDELKFENEIIKMEKLQDEYYYVTAIYFYQAMSLKYINEKKYYDSFKKLLKKFGEKFSYIDRINFYSIMQAICTLKIEAGLKNYEMELFKSYNEMLSKDLISINPGGNFMIKLYRNFIQTGVLLKKFDWVNTLVKNYSHRLPPESKDNLLKMTEALVLFEKKEFEKSLEKISQIDYDIFHFKIDLKLLQLKIFTELNLANELLSLIDSFKHFVSQNKFISVRYRDKLKKFLTQVLRYIHLKDHNDYDGLELLNKNLDQIGDIPNKEWLKRKIADAIK